MRISEKANNNPWRALFSTSRVLFLYKMANLFRPKPAILFRPIMANLFQPKLVVLKFGCFNKISHTIREAHDCEFKRSKE